MRPVNVSVSRKDGEPFDVMFKRFTRLIKRNEILEEYRERMYYVKPSKKKHDKNVRIKHIFEIKRKQSEQEEGR